MSTCALIKFIDTSGHEYVSVYHHYDGYLSGVGEKLAKFLHRTKIISGIYKQKLSDHVANGYGCLIAQYIALNKKDVGNVYIFPIDEDTSDYIDYVYYVIYNNKDDTMKIRVVNGSKIFEGSPEELLEFIREN